jgi:kynurenine formamidase
MVRMTALAKRSQPLQRSKHDFDRMMEALSNWGRWGKDDERGALNLITAAKRKQAAMLVQDGFAVSLARDAIKVAQFNSTPFEHRMIQTGLTPESNSSGDIYTAQYHGFTLTHLDALCHVFYDGKMYNGFSQQEVREHGAGRLSVLNIKDGIFTRGILMDFPRLLGVKYLEATQAIFPKDLDHWERQAGVRVEPGDAVFISTGRWARYEAEGEWAPQEGSAGLDMSCMPWFKSRDVALLGSDLALDVMPSGVTGVMLPVHTIALVAMGVPILDCCDFTAASEAAGERNRWEFLVSVSPLAVEGGTGSPVNPLAAF